jgi:hypothetical protein
MYEALSIKLIEGDLLHLAVTGPQCQTEGYSTYLYLDLNKDGRLGLYLADVLGPLGRYAAPHLHKAGVVPSLYRSQNNLIS